MLENISSISPFSHPGRDPVWLNSDQPNYSYSSCDYSWQHYNHDCYKRYGIQRPAELANATARRHCEFIAGRHCASQAIQSLQQSPDSASQAQIPMQPDRSPRWPGGIIGSISHSDGRAMAVVGSADKYAGLGIDCETLLTDSGATEITDMVLEPLEKALLLNRQGDFGFLLTLAFSAKESLFKALSPSFTVVKSFHDFSIYSISANKLILRPTKRLNGNWSETTEFRIDYTRQEKQLLTMAVITTPDR